MFTDLQISIVKTQIVSNYNPREYYSFKVYAWNNKNWLLKLFSKQEFLVIYERLTEAMDILDFKKNLYLRRVSTFHTEGSNFDSSDFSLENIETMPDVIIEQFKERFEKKVEKVTIIRTINAKL